MLPAARTRVQPARHAALSRSRLAATRRDIDPATISAPFDRDASGFINGEGSGILVLESLEHARARGARIYAELVSYAAANDAGDVLRPNPEGRAFARALQQCMDRGEIAVENVSAVFAPASSVPGYDSAIASALTKVVNGHGRPAVTALRSLLGHTHAASAAIDCVAAVKAIQAGVVPATANLRQPIATLPFVTGSAREQELPTVVVGAWLRRPRGGAGVHGFRYEEARSHHWRRRRLAGGHRREPFWEGLKDGRSGVDVIGADASALPCNFRGSARLCADDYVDTLPSTPRRLPRGVDLRTQRARRGRDERPTPGSDREWIDSSLTRHRRRRQDSRCCRGF